MKQLTIADLMSLEEYAKQRESFRKIIMQHKKNRQVQVGPNSRFYFEDQLTVQYQVQEMLRIERIFEQEDIQEELTTYNSLIPSGHNLKGTFMFEFPDIEVRKEQLNKLGGAEHNLQLQVHDFAPVTAIVNEDLERTTETKTSAVHFFRFELRKEIIAELENHDTKVILSVNHSNYSYSETLSKKVVDALSSDFS